MRVAMLNPPFRLPGHPADWITVPPQGYGGIQWVVATLIDGLLAAGWEVALLGAPGSPARRGLMVTNVTDRRGTVQWLATNRVDVVHDHTNGDLLPAIPTRPTISTFHLTGVPVQPANCVYVSESQRADAGSADAPVIRLPVNPDLYQFISQKQNYLLFLGRVSRHKGVMEAAGFAAAAGLPLSVAGPSWEPEYLAAVTACNPQTVEYVGEVGGHRRLDLISHARAVLVMSQPVPGPFGDIWSEPGATVVSEAAASGTPVLATPNGCLPEIVPGVGHIMPYWATTRITTSVAEASLEVLPPPPQVRAIALERWSHHKIAAAYLDAYDRVIHGDEWS